MPIYAYRCDHCGFAKDALQKISDAPLTDCPSCGTAGAFKKQLTAAGFQLKGSGWYVTDFRGGNSGAPSTPASPAGAGATGGAASTTPSEGAGSTASAAKDSASTPAPAASSTTSSGS